MKASFRILLLILVFPLGLLTASGASDHGQGTEAHAGAHGTYGDAAGGETSEGNKLTMITEKFGVELPTLIAQMVNFILVAIVLYIFAVKPIASTLEERQQKIAEGLQYAEEMKSQLAQTERERHETIKQAAVQAQTIVSEAREQAKELIEQKTQEAAAQAEAILRKAGEASELERQKMLSEVRQEVARLVVVTSGKVLERDLSESEKTNLADSAAKELADAG